MCVFKLQTVGGIVSLFLTDLIKAIYDFITQSQVN